MSPRETTREDNYLDIIYTEGSVDVNNTFLYYL
jgi:hypothetical protein